MKGIGTIIGGNFSWGNAINDLGQVTGGSTIAGDALYHAFLYHAGTGMQDIGALGDYSVGNGINNFGQVTGWYLSLESPNYTSHAFLYSAGKMIDLMSLLPASSGWTVLYTGTGINDLGQITGYGVINGQEHAFLMTPVF
jgi:probable HAF family extracellular repeat protein